MSPLLGATIIYRGEYFIYFNRHFFEVLPYPNSEQAFRETGMNNAASVLKMLIVYNNGSPVCPRDGGLEFLTLVVNTMTYW